MADLSLFALDSAPEPVPCMESIPPLEPIPAVEPIPLGNPFHAIPIPVLTVMIPI